MGENSLIFKLRKWRLNPKITKQDQSTSCNNAAHHSSHPLLWQFQTGDKKTCTLVIKSKAHFTLAVKANFQLKSSIPIAPKVEISPKCFTLRVKANVQLKSSIPTGAKVEISPKGLTLEVKAEIEKIFSICPKLLNNSEHYGLVLAPRLKKGYHQIWEANLQPLGANVSTFINIMTSMF